MRISLLVVSTISAADSAPSASSFRNLAKVKDTGANLISAPMRYLSICPPGSVAVAIVFFTFVGCAG